MAKIDCLMGTYGRYELACEALACFLQQSRLSEATLLIYNQHLVPLHFDHPRVRVVNETPSARSLRHIRQRMHELADPAAEFIHWWDDDDLYLPWHLDDCLAHIGEHVAWKPASSWISQNNVSFELHRSQFEGSWLFRADYVRNASLHGHPNYTDHPMIRELQNNNLVATTELAGRTSYIYRWATGAQHVSGYGAAVDDDGQVKNIESWRRQSDDVRADGKLVSADLTLRWRQYLDGTKHLVTAEEWESNRSRLAL